MPWCCPRRKRTRPELALPLPPGLAWREGAVRAMTRHRDDNLAFRPGERGVRARPMLQQGTEWSNTTARLVVSDHRSRKAMRIVRVHLFVTGTTAPFCAATLACPSNAWCRRLCRRADAERLRDHVTGSLARARESPTRKGSSWSISTSCSSMAATASTFRGTRGARIRSRPRRWSCKASTTTPSALPSNSMPMPSRTTSSPSIVPVASLAACASSKPVTPTRRSPRRVPGRLVPLLASPRRPERAQTRHQAAPRSSQKAIDPSSVRTVVASGCPPHVPRRRLLRLERWASNGKQHSGER